MEEEEKVEEAMEEAEAAAGFFRKSCWIWALRLVLLAWLWGAWVGAGWVG